MMASRERLDPSACLRTEPSTKASGLSRKTRKIEEAFRSGPTEADTMGSGEMAWLTDRADSCMLREMSTRANGPMTKQTDRVFILISTDPGTTANGTRTSSTALVSSSGRMAPSMRATTSRA